MKPTKSVLVLAFLLAAPTVASAQGYYGGGGGYAAPASQLPGGFHNRQGRIIFGGSVGLGGMNENGQDVECANCNYSPLAVAVAGHIGGFVGPRLALMGELQVNAQTVATDGYDDLMMVQGAVMFAAQYWVTPQLWVKGGIGVAHLSLQDSYGIYDEVPENGLALLGAVGYELMSARHFSVDLQARLINGSYDSVNTNVSAASLGLGINWF